MQEDLLNALSTDILVQYEMAGLYYIILNVKISCNDETKKDSLKRFVEAQKKYIQAQKKYTQVIKNMPDNKQENCIHEYKEKDKALSEKFQIMMERYPEIMADISQEK